MARHPAPRAAGFTLLELVIAGFVGALVIAGAMYLLVQQNRTYSVIEQTSETQLNLRAIAQMIDHDLRHTGLLVPEGAALCGRDHDAPDTTDTDPDELYVTDAGAVAARGMTSAVGAVGNVSSPTTMTASATTVGKTDFTLTSLVLDNNPFYDPTSGAAAVTRTSDFQVKHAAILVNLDRPHNGTACGEITKITGTKVKVDLINSIAIQAGDEAFLVPAHRYSVDDGVLSRDGLALAAEITDLQFAVFFDLDNDRVQDPGELLGSGDGATTPPYVSVGTGAPGSTTARNHGLVRFVRVNLVGTTSVAVETAVTGAKSFTEHYYPENRSRVAPTPDGLRRRLHTTTTQLRNVGNRGTLLPRLPQ